jgi:CRISPR-associated protein Csx17
VTNSIVLGGCRRLPLADYLKALGVFRIVAEQIDPEVRGAWSRGVFVLQTTLERERLLEFFATAYSPTPIVAPWNGGSGFYPKDTPDGIRAIEASDTERLARYRQSIAICRSLVADLNLTERPKDDEKRAFVERLRAELPDDALHWLDAAVALEEDGAAFPPLLGTGGNDGRLDFSNNQMQRISEVMLGRDCDHALLRAALFDEPARNLVRVAIGQFRPTSAGGANAVEGFDRASLVNPWDYILAIEGSLMFAGAVTRRLESAAPGAASFPFTVRASGAGYGSAAVSDEADARDEIWLPVWSRFATCREIRAVFAEGRATVGARGARNGVDFARAIASLGIERGIDAFSRVGFLVRNGLSYFATPLGEWNVEHVPSAGLLADLDDWLLQLGRAASGKNASASLRRAAARVDDAILGVCRRGRAEDVSELLVALGGIEAVCARSPKARESVRPLPALSEHWVDAADDSSVELRLAAALAAGGIRRYLSTARRRGRITLWADDDGSCVWTDRPLVDNLIAVARRREIMDEWPALEGSIAAGAADIAAFIAGDTDDERLSALVWGLCSASCESTHGAGGDPRALPSVFAVTRLALTPRPAPGIELLHTSGVISRLAAGDAVTATRAAEHRLRGAGLVPRCGPMAVDARASRRMAAALLFPLAPSTIAAMRRQIIRTTTLENLDHGNHRS